MAEGMLGEAICSFHEGAQDDERWRIKDSDSVLAFE